MTQKNMVAMLSGPNFNKTIFAILLSLGIIQL